MNERFTWYHNYELAPQFSKPVAYFSMEFAIDQALKIYSGGLGYLAGSHMRSAYELKQNMVGIGMLWQLGYYDQLRDKNGYMQAFYQKRVYSFLEDTGVIVKVFVNGHPVYVKAMYLAPEVFQTVPMFFLTTDLPENDFLSRSITERLYHPNDAARIAQNIVLGIGGSKVLETLGWIPEIFHMNEAHSLPIACHLYQKYQDINEVKRRLVFTTHTPEKAGNSVRSTQLLTEMGFFNGIDIQRAREIMGMDEDDFEYTPAALRMAKIANGVSQLHGEVARKMWQSYEGICEITSITNAQNQKYWQDITLKNALDTNNDELLRYRKKQLKKELFKIVADQTGKLFNANTLTVVWARRFAAYKRANLIARDVNRFLALLNNAKYPVQMIWAGKPYPEDHESVSMFNNMMSLSHRHKNVAVLTGYELALSASLKKGADIWLNTPRRPQEASGTSGMTAAMNAAVNVSTNDGWIPEFAVNGKNSFIIPEADLNKTIPDQDQHDYDYLMSLIEFSIIPMYYDEPQKWLTIVKNSMMDVLPRFGSNRMAAEYYERLFV